MICLLQTLRTSSGMASFYAESPACKQLTATKLGSSKNLSRISLGVQRITSAKIFDI